MKNQKNSRLSNSSKEEMENFASQHLEEIDIYYLQKILQWKKVSSILLQRNLTELNEKFSADNKSISCYTRNSLTSHQLDHDICPVLYNCSNPLVDTRNSISCYINSRDWVRDGGFHSQWVLYFQNLVKIGVVYHVILSSESGIPQV